MARRTGFYLDKRNAKLIGVCSGIADYTGFDVLWVRVAMVLGFVLGGGLTGILYVILAVFADAKPASFYDHEDADPDDRAFWQKTRAAPSRTIREVRSNFRDIDRRLREIELQYTSPSSKLAREIDELRHG